MQAGAGIVADSDPEAEDAARCENKARALLRARRRGRGTSVAPMILVVDNYDSFTYNLVQILGELGGGRAASSATTR